MSSAKFMSYFSLASWKRYASDVYLRITLNKLTIWFLIFSIIHCFSQGFIQTVHYNLDNGYLGITEQIVHQGNISQKLVPALYGNPGSVKIELCNKVPMFYQDTCTTVFSPEVRAFNIGVADTRMGSRTIRLDQDFIFESDLTVSNDGTGAVGVRAFTSDLSVDFSLNPVCPEVLAYLAKVINQIRREDITWICLHFALFFISFLAVLNRSVSHLLTALIIRFLATAFAAYSIWRTDHRRRWFLELVSDPTSACTMDFFGPYSTVRLQYDIYDVVSNFIGLIIASYLSVRLYKDYTRKGFNTVGATETVYRIQKFFDAVLCVLELEVSVVLIAMALWIDELSTGPLAHVTEKRNLYRAGVIATAITLWPWIALGWYSIRKESNKGIYVFMLYAFMLIFVWSFMFYSHSYRWTFYDWPYFGCYVTASLILLVASFILSLVCRLNFGKGLKEYLNAEEALQATGIQPEVFVKTSSDNEKEDSDTIPEDADPAYYLKKFTDVDLSHDNTGIAGIPSLYKYDVEAGTDLAKTVSGASKLSLQPNRLGL